MGRWWPQSQEFNPFRRPAPSPAPYRGDYGVPGGPGFGPQQYPIGGRTPIGEPEAPVWSTPISNPREDAKREYSSQDPLNPWVQPPRELPPILGGQAPVSTTAGGWGTPGQLPPFITNLLASVLGGAQGNGQIGNWASTSSGSAASGGVPNSTPVKTAPWSTPVPRPGGPGFGGLWAGSPGSVTPSGSTSLPGADDPEVWYKNYMATGGVSRAEFDAVWNDPTQRAAFQSAISENMAKKGTTSGTTGGAGGSTGYNNRYAGLYSAYRVDPSWVEAYQAKHGGKDPISDYGSFGAVVGQPGRWSEDRTPEQALRSAQWDKNWGDQYAKTYGHGPSDQEWAESYLYREAQKQRGVNPGG